MRLDIHVHVHSYYTQQFLKILGKLDEIERSLNMAATKSDFDSAIAALKQAIANLAAKVQPPPDLTPELQDIQAATAQVDALTATLP